MDDERAQNEAHHRSESSADEDSDLGYEPDVSSGDVLDADELDQEIADDEGMAGTVLHEASPAGAHALQPQVGASAVGGRDDEGAQHDPHDAHERDAHDPHNAHEHEAHEHEAHEHDAVDHAEHDSQLDAELDSWDDGSDAVGRSATSGALPFVVWRVRSSPHSETSR